MATMVDTSRSPHARLRPVPLSSVRLADAFWEPRRRVNRAVTLPSQYRQCEETGRINNFRRAAGKNRLPFQGRYYNDSDVYKWVEAVAFSLAESPDPELERLVDLVIAEIADAQQADGYLNTHFMFEREEERWSNLRDLHELYCAGHLIQAAVAHHRCTGNPLLLSVARRFADLICRTFGPEGRPGTCGHQEIEMALVELYRETGEARYLDQARRFIEMRGLQPPVIGGRPYHQDHAPFRSLDAVVGHAVRMMYYCCGAADVYAETGDPEYLAALERLWANMTQRRMYVTGGMGARYEGEAFGGDYELPNDRAYAESCAAIGSVMWNWRMLQLRGEARFADLIERTLYNAVLPGLSLEGNQYFYQNPLADDGQHRRRPWFDCACCPPNIARLLASLPAYFYSTSIEGAWVHQYATGSADLHLPAGAGARLVQRTNYPWSREVEVEVHPEQSGEFALFLRIPEWGGGAEISINGQALDGPCEPGTYAEIRRHWRAGDTVRLTLPMRVRRIAAHPHVTANAGRIALAWGPLIYCAEQVDLGVDPRDVVLTDGSELRADWNPDLLGGVIALRGGALVRCTSEQWGTGLYRERPVPPAPSREIDFTAVPYYAWGNREPGGMAVWLAAGS